MDRRRSLVKTTLLLLPLQVVFRSVEAVFPVLLAVFFGRSAATDVYTLEWAVFSLAAAVLFSAFQDSAVVPILAEVRVKAPKALAAIRGSLLVHTLAVGAVLGLVVGGLAAAWFALYFSSSGTDRALALCMAPPFVLYLVALGTRSFFASMLNADHFYVPLPVASALGAVASVAVVLLGHRALSVIAVPCGSLACELVAVAVLAGSARTAGIAIAPTFARPEPVRRIAALVAAEAFGSAVTKVNPVVDQFVATLVGVVGGGTLLRLSGDVATVPTSLLQAALLPVLLTHLSEDFAAGDLANLRAVVRRSLAVVSLSLGAASLALWAARVPVLRLVFAHGAMDEAGVARMAHLLAYHLVGIVPFGALLVLARAHVAAQNSRIMVGMGLLNAGLNAALNAVFAPMLGLEGIALSTSCTSAVVAAVFWARLDARLASMHRTGVEPAA